MPKGLLIAEKPSLMREIQNVYEKHKNELDYEIDFESQRGHLVTTFDPNELSESLSKISWDTIPIFPENYGGWQYKIIKEKKTGNFKTASERYAILKTKIRSGDYDFIIHAGDPDQEGELLVNLVLLQIGTKLPVKRFWTNDLTEGHVLNALKNLRDDRNDKDLVHLLDAAFVRQHSDWLFGMNVSRAATLKMNNRVACGRVMTFIQSCVVQRDKAIENFKPSTTYGVKINYKNGFSGSYFDRAHIENGDDATEEGKQGIVWFQTKDEAQAVLDKLQNVTNAKVLMCNTQHNKKFAPSLFKLSTLQIYAGKYGLTPDGVLTVVQSLYEKKIMSYPRTSCEYIGSSEDFRGILNALSSVEELKPFIDKITDADIEKVRGNRKWVDDKKIETEGHTALRPTTLKANLEELTPVEKKIYIDIAKRFVAMFMAPWEFENVELISVAGGYTFKSTGKTTTSRGYLDILNQKTIDVELPKCSINDTLPINDFEIPEKTTKCPSYFTQADLIAVCENPAKYLDDKRLKSLGKRLTVGTEATRAGIINKLINKNHYLETFKNGKKEYVRATKNGTAIINNLDGLMICKPDMTGEWEEYLENVRTGKSQKNDVETQIKRELIDMLDEIKEKDMESIGCMYKCPKCGARMIEHGSFYGCSNYPDCDFTVSKTPYGAKMTEHDFDLLFDGEKTDIKTMKSKSGKEFTAQLFFNEEHKVDLDFSALRQETDCDCPRCGRKLIKSKTGWSCPGYNDAENQCKFTIWYSSYGGKLTDKDIEAIVKNGITDREVSLKSKAGKKYKAKLKLEDYKLIPDFGESKAGDMTTAIRTDYKCPKCGSPLFKRGQLLYCEKGSSCGFKMYTSICGKELTDERIKELIEDSVTSTPISGLKSKKGNEFTAILKRDDEGKISFDFNFESHT